MLNIQAIDVSYSGIRALQGVSLSINQGEIVAIVGSNGAGKSTLVRTISGLLKPDKGQIVFEGNHIENLAPNRIVRLGIAHIPEGRHIFADLTVLENLYAGAFIEKDKSAIEERLDQVYGLFPILKDRGKQRGGTLSGGQQQMLAIGRALMCNPKMLILDEPSLGIAPNLAHQILNTLPMLRDGGKTILLIEQAIQNALSIADRGYVLQTGQIVLEGTSKDLLGSEMVKKAYLGL